MRKAAYNMRGGNFQQLFPPLSFLVNGAPRGFCVIRVLWEETNFLERKGEKVAEASCL